MTNRRIITKSSRERIASIKDRAWARQVKRWNA